jgi:hypothetical protein
MSILEIFLKKITFKSLSIESNANDVLQKFLIEFLLTLPVFSFFKAI